MSINDAVLDLPWLKGSLNSPWFSGFLNAGIKDGKSVRLHYVLVECETLSPQEAPLIVWLNGGPGASSLFGLFVELGPLLIVEGSKELVRNEFTWAKKANVLFLNSPAPVGFSYCEDPAGSFTSCGAWNDSSVAMHNRLAIHDFVNKNPRYRQNDWFFMGESYGGIYVRLILF
jgi:carboxypeptidase C (cathepsin A)